MTHYYYRLDDRKIPAGSQTRSRKISSARLINYRGCLGLISYGAVILYDPGLRGSGVVLVHILEEKI